MGIYFLDTIKGLWPSIEWILIDSSCDGFVAFELVGGNTTTILVDVVGNKINMRSRWFNAYTASAELGDHESIVKAFKLITEW
jgi:hypothetical protein